VAVAPRLTVLPDASFTRSIAAFRLDSAQTLLNRVCVQDFLTLSATRQSFKPLILNALQLMPKWLPV